MKYCNKCGSQIDDESVLCPNCGCVSDNDTYQRIVKGNSQSGIKTAAMVFNILSIVACSLIAFYYSFLLAATQFSIFALFVIISALPLSWCIPMTIHYSKSIKTHTPVSIGFKICCLIFLNLIGGILMLVDND